MAAGMVGGMVTQPNIEPWYAHLRKPPLTPPNGLFAPAWGVLFLLMGIALWLIASAEPSPTRTAALVLFGLQLALNMAWSWVFFGARATGWALVEITLFWITLAATLFFAARISTVAGLLLAPYLAWVSFASYLNAGVWWLNRREAPPGSKA